MIVPGLIAVLAPVVAGYILGISGLGGLLAGALGGSYRALPASGKESRSKGMNQGR